MQLPVYVKPYPKVIAWVLPHFGGNSIYPYIFVRPEIYTGLTSDQPNPKHLATLAHELHHRQRQQNWGWLRWSLLYLFSRRFRFEEELSAYKITMQVRKHYQQDFNVQHCAQILSGPSYLWCTTYPNAFKHVQAAWNSAKALNPDQLIKF